MRPSCLGFALLVWIPGVLHAVGAPKTCRAPKLKNGYFLPVHESYRHEEIITYSCDTGYKLQKEGWWARSTCNNGEWSEEPQCVAETACLHPVIPNGTHKQSSKTSFEDGSTLEINCNEGYVLGSDTATARCTRGTWSDVPVCQKHRRACSQPPYIPNAVIKQEDKELFPEFSRVEYECRSEFLNEDREPTKLATCINGTWSGTPRCSPSGKPASKDTEPPFISIHHCGKIPEVTDGVVLQQDQRFVKYKCQRYYKMVGSDTVVCHSNGEWSGRPRCKEDFCVLRPGDYPDLKLTGSKYLSNGDTEQLDCVDKFHFHNSAQVRCFDGKLYVSECCNWFQVNALSRCQAGSDSLQLA